ncbi:hypothetical protein H4582DRAFT_2062277 [Lactarius indigo]|nr:hypothetical protein H4582DRAFT_2062277 [Lactarius indigo]
MVWGWAIASFFIFIVGLSVAELASAAPTSGGMPIPLGPSLRSLQLTGAWRFKSWLRLALGHMVPLPLRIRKLCLLLHSYSSFQLAHQGYLQWRNVYVALNILLCLAVIIALPAVTSRELKNSASYALGNFTNWASTPNSLYDWPNGFAFILSFLAPLWTICSFDSAVHISEEASNAVIAVPWGIIWAIGMGGVLGWAAKRIACMGPQCTYDICPDEIVIGPCCQVAHGAHTNDNWVQGSLGEFSSMPRGGPGVGQGWARHIINNMYTLYAVYIMLET